MRGDGLRLREQELELVDPLHQAVPREATYAENRAKLLGALDGVPDEKRSAAFRSVAFVAWPDGRELSVEGVCLGRIASSERGTRGFGYDPVFVPLDGDGRTFAEMGDDEKHALSHRGRAFRALAATLAGQLPAP